MLRRPLEPNQYLSIRYTERLAAARLRHIAGTQWGSKRYLKMDLLRDLGLPETRVA